MNFETRFNQVVSSWEIYCGSSAVQNNLASRTIGENYQNVVGLGPDAVELLFDRYGKRKENTPVGVAWAKAIEDILQSEDPEFVIPHDIRYAPEKVKEYIGDYLEKRRAK